MGLRRVESDNCANVRGVLGCSRSGNVKNEEPQLATRNRAKAAVQPLCVHPKFLGPFTLLPKEPLELLKCEFL